LDIEGKTIPNTKKEHLERSTGAPTSEGSRTKVPVSEGSSTQVPVSEAPTLPKSGTQSTFNPELEAPKSTKFSVFLDKLFYNF
jgi:hypothetical protein